jgi:5-methylcytosine-specific restriction protein A
MDLVSDAADALEAMSGMPLETCDVERGGFRGRGVRIAGIEPGKGLAVALTITASSVEASAFPEVSAGPLVRRFWQYAEAHEEELSAEVASLEATGIAVVVAINEQIVDIPDVTNAQQTPWWSVEIECRKRLGVRQRDTTRECLIEVGAAAMALVLSGLEQVDVEDDGSDVENAIEGRRTTHQISRYERSPANRMRCIAHHGSTCAACGLDFGSRYGDIGTGFIEVHHRTPVSTIGGPAAVDPITDLVPLCPNCHAMVHRRSPPYDPEEIRLLLGSTSPGESA